MLFLTGLFLLALAAMAWAPETPFGKSLRDWLVEKPAGAIGRLTPAKIVIGLIVAVLLIGMAMSAPEIVAMIGFGDLAVYLDAAVIVSLLAWAARLKFAAQQTVRLGRALSRRLVARRHGNRTRARKTHRHRRKSPPSSDEEAGPFGGWAFA
jgi:hypothetical protein